MSRRAVAALLALLFAGLIVLVWSVQRRPASPLVPAPPDSAVLHDAVDELLTASAADWNAGDLDGFMRWYEPGDRTTYVGAAGLVRGREAIRERYAPLFEPDAERDSLRFEDLRVRPLAPGLGLAIARYVLYRPGAGTTSHGIFTLVLSEGPGDWRIVHDHSSEIARVP